MLTAFTATTHIISHIYTAISDLSTVASNLQSKLQRDIGFIVPLTFGRYYVQLVFL